MSSTDYKKRMKKVPVYLALSNRLKVLPEEKEALKRRHLLVLHKITAE